MDELRTKPEVQISVWADGNNGYISFLGMCRVQLLKVASAKFQDCTLTDQITRERITFQTRVLHDSPKLTSAFKDKA